MMNHQRWKCYHSYLSQPQWHSTPAQKRMSWAGHDIFHSETKISRHHVILKTWPSRQKAETVQFLKIKSSCTHFISTLSVAQWFLIVTGVNNSKHQSRVFTWQCQRVSSAQEVHLYEFMYIHIYIHKFDTVTLRIEQVVGWYGCPEHKVVKSLVYIQIRSWFFTLL